MLAAAAAASTCGPPPPPSGVAHRLNSSLPAIDVLYDLAASDVELAVLLGIAAPRHPPALEPGAELSDAAVAAVVGDATRAGGSGDPWYYDGREPGIVYAGYANGDVAMRVAIRFDEDIVLLRILSSRNLEQTESTIRVDAFTRLATLDERIRRTILSVAQRNRYGTPIPPLHPDES